jgi:hypothetical protein
MFHFFLQTKRLIHTIFALKKHILLSLIITLLAPTLVPAEEDLSVSAADAYSSE